MPGFRHRGHGSAVAGRFLLVNLPYFIREGRGRERHVKRAARGGFPGSQEPGGRRIATSGLPSHAQGRQDGPSRAAARRLASATSSESWAAPSVTSGATPQPRSPPRPGRRGSPAGPRRSAGSPCPAWPPRRPGPWSPAPAAAAPSTPVASTTSRTASKIRLGRAERPDAAGSRTAATDRTRCPAAPTRTRPSTAGHTAAPGTPRSRTGRTAPAAPPPRPAPAAASAAGRSARGTCRRTSTPETTPPGAQPGTRTHPAGISSRHVYPHIRSDQLTSPLTLHHSSLTPSTKRRGQNA